MTQQPPRDYAALSLSRSACETCVPHASLEFDFTYAFQPIVDIETKTIFSYEALARGPQGESAAWVLAQVNAGNQYRFDQMCRVRAITLASKLDISSRLNINFLPNAIYRPEDCIKTTLAVANKLHFPIERIIFEVIESEQLENPKHLVDIFSAYRKLGFSTAIDDFGAGFAGLNLLADFNPDFIKLDMQLVRGIHADRSRQAIVRGIVAVCLELSIRIIAEGIETLEEYHTLADMGITLFQGYLFGRPVFENLGPLILP